MGIFINNSQRKSDFRLISDLLNQIQNALSDPNITDDVKQEANLALSELSTNVSQQNMRKNVARDYTILQLEQVLNTLESGRNKYQPTYIDAPRSMREMVLFDPETPVDPITLDGGTTPDKQKRVQQFAYNLWNQLNNYQKYISDDNYAVEGWNIDNTNKVKKWLLDLSVKNNMDDATLNKKIAIMSNIVDSLGHDGLIDSHFQYFSPFDVEKPVEPEKEQEKPQLKTWTYGGNTYTEAPYFGPISEYLLDQGYEIGELDGKYYVFENRLPATTNGWHAVLDPTSSAYQTAYKFAGNGLLDYGIYDEEFSKKIGSEENTKLRNKIIAEHNKKFPVEYYSQQGDYDIIDLSNYMTDTDPANPEIIYYQVSPKYQHGLWIDWDEIFKNRPDWKSRFKYSGDADYNFNTDLNPLNLYATKHGYVVNAELPKIIASNDDLTAFLESDFMNRITSALNIKDKLNKETLGKTYLEQLSLIVTLILRGTEGMTELYSSYPLLKDSVNTKDLANGLFSQEWKKEVGGKVKYSTILYQLLKSNPNIYKKILLNIMKTATNGKDRKRAYEKLLEIKNTNPSQYSKGGILKFDGGGGIEPYLLDSLNFSPKTILMGAPVISEIPSFTMGDPDESDGKTYETFKDLLEDEDVRNPLILRGTALLSDMAAAGASNIVGYGTVAAGGLGLLSTGLEAVADYIDPSVSSKEAWRNAGTNLALTGVGLIPNAKFFTAASKGAKLLGNVFMKALQYGITAQSIAGSLGIASHAFPRFWEMITSDDWKWTQEDAMLIMHTLNMVINGAKAANSKVKMKRVQKQVVDPNHRVVEFTGKDGQAVQVKMTEDQYDSYINAGRKAERGKRDEVALKKAQEIVKSTMGQLAADNISGNTISFSGLAKGWYSRPNYGPASLFNSPGGYVKKLLHLGAEPILPATLRPDITDTSNLPSSVSYVTGHGLSGSKSQTPKTPKKRDIVIENGKPVEYQKSVAAKNTNSPIFKGIDFSKPTELHKYPNKQNLPKAVRSVPDDLLLDEVSTKEALKKFNYTLGTSEKVRGGIVYDNKLYWWKSGGKLDRLNNYLLNK